MIGVGTTNLMIRDAQFHHAIGDGQIEVLGIPLGEVPGVRRRIVPHRPLGWRRADHAGLAAEAIGDASEGVHAASLSHRRSSRNQANARGAARWGSGTVRPRTHLIDFNFFNTANSREAHSWAFSRVSHSNASTRST